MGAHARGARGHAPQHAREGAVRAASRRRADDFRLRRELRDDAGFSLAQIGQLLEDETARERNRERFRATRDAAERRAIIVEARERVERQVETLKAKRERLDAMIAEAERRRQHLDDHLKELDDGGPDPHPGEGRHP